jgi:uncharacterized protein
MLIPLWKNLIKFNLAFGLTLVLLFGIPRFILVLNAAVTGNHGAVSLIFLLMWLAPFVFLSKEGRKSIGMVKSQNYYWIFYSLIAGALFCVLMYGLAVALFDFTDNNWFVYISHSYTSGKMAVNDSNRFVYFLIYAFIGMTFSPIGEELFYRGIVHGSFAEKYGNQKASTFDSLAFALTHLAHFGIIYQSGTWSFLAIPSLLWVLCMFLASKLFFICKEKTGSLLGAIACHAAYNCAMVYFIFYHIL